MDRGAAARPARRVNDQPQRDHFSIVPEFVVFCENARAIQIYTLAERAQCSQDTVDRAIKFLTALGALTYIPGGPGRANVYTLKVAALTRVQVAAPTRVGSRTDAGTGSRTHAALTKANNENHEPDLAISRSRWKNRDYWDAIETVFNHRPHPESGQTGVWGRLAKMAQDLGDDPAEIVQRAAAWTVGDVWQGWKVPPRLTPAALLKHYQWLGSDVAQASEAELDAWRMQWRRASRQAALTDNPRTASPDRKRLLHAVPS